jgi:hypothetical protein
MVLRMKSIMLAGALAAFASVPAQAADRSFTVTGFDRIEVDGPFEVVLATGRASSAMASGSPQAIDRVSIEVSGRTLRIRPNRSSWGGYPGEGAGPLKIKVSTHELRSATVTGSGSIAIDRAKNMRFDVSVAGSGKIGIGSIEADNLFVALLGSGRISLAGKAKELTVTIKGSGDFDAASLTADEAKINADTAGNIALAVRRAATVNATGQGDTMIAGKPACQVKASGSGRVVCGG